MVISACSFQQDPILRIGTNQWPGYETLYLARDLGLFDQHHIKLIEQTSATETLRAFKQGQIDVAALTLDEVLSLAQTENDLRVFLVMDISNGSDKVMALPEITALADLKGKGIAVENTAVGAYMLHQLLATAQIKPDEISIHSTTVNQQLKHINDGHCVALVTFEPMATKLEQLGYRDLFNSHHPDVHIIDVLVTRQHVVSQQEQNLKAVITSQWKTLAYMQENREDAYWRIMPRLGISHDNIEKSFQGLILPDLDANKQLFDNSSTASIGKIALNLSAVLVQAQILESTPNIDQLLTGHLMD